MDLLHAVARFYANSDRANLNCNRNPSNSKFLNKKRDFFARNSPSNMKTHTNLYNNLCSFKNLYFAYKKARENKTKKDYVIKFENNLEQELKTLKEELELLTYKPKPLKRFIIKDPKTRVIHSSNFRDRVIHHALVNILEPIFDKIFIHDSYASRIGKGTLKALERFDQFKRKISKNGRIIKNELDNNQVQGYVFKADIKHYFDTVDHDMLLKIIERKIKDEKVIWLVKQILKNFIVNEENKGMPLGNLTSQFFANVYLNELDYFIKHKLKSRYYIRYVDDFVILHSSKEQLEIWNKEINEFLINNLKLELHNEKSKVTPLAKGLDFLGFKNFYYYRSLRKRNIRKFFKNLNNMEENYNNKNINYDAIYDAFGGWLAYAMLGNTYNLRRKITKRIEELFNHDISSAEVNRLLKVCNQYYYKQ